MKSLIFLIVLFVFSACRFNEYIIDEGETKLVIEGWIDEGDVARVLLSRSIPVTERVDSISFLLYSVRSAMVIVSDGIEYDTLRLTSTSRHLPPFLYVGSKIIGQTGGTYKLYVIWQSKTYTAETIIPPSVSIDDVRYIRDNPTDTIGSIEIKFTQPFGKQKYYQIATMLEGHDRIYVPCLYGNFNSINFASSDVRIKLSRGVTVFPRTNIDSNFKDGDVIRIRLRTMSKEGFDFWNIWQNEIINSQNAIFPANKSLKSNITGGIGIWCGYGQSTVRITAR